MKRKIFLGCTVLCASILLCGFDSSKSASDVLEKSAQSAASAGSVSAEMDLDCDVALALTDGEVSTSFPIKLSLDSEIETILNPFALGMEGDMDMQILTSSSSKIQLYCVTQGSTTTDLYYSYSDSSDDPSWTHLSFDGADLTDLLTSLSTADFSSLKKIGLDFSLSSDPAQFQGEDCYLISVDSASLPINDALSAFLSDSAVDSLLSSLSDLLGTDITGDELSNMLGDLKINIQYYVDCDSYLPLGLHIDLNDSNLSDLGTMVADVLKDMLSSFQSEDVEDNTTVDIEINDLSMDYSLSYDNVDSVTVPDAALQTPASSY